MLATLLQTTSDDGGVSAGLIVGYMIFYVAFLVLMIASLWKIFTKAGQSGWTAIIPVLNSCVMAHVAKREWWWGLLLLIPCVGFVIGVIILIDLAKAFGKSGAYALGLILLPFIFFPLLGFGSSEYQGGVEKLI